MADRGGIPIMRFIMLLMVGAILVNFVTPIFNRLETATRPEIQNQSVNQSAGWIAGTVTNFPLIFLVIASLGLVVYSIYEREVV